VRGKAPVVSGDEHAAPGGRVCGEPPRDLRFPLRVDAAMRDAVRRYQRARGLTADGVIGPETLMALSSGEAGPRLLRVLE